MRLERIELIGFKSFAEKTIFNFHPGITAIVGPNGCGKSNVVDAFKWVLGEQSAKSLRGDSMEDVIFFGSATKKTKGMAEVTLILSGATEKSLHDVEGHGESEAGKISVTRRLYRSGESEYLMNKVPCRLKDIKNLFLDTGLELKAYSILEQGRINNILSSKPQERRFLIEEVAGVMKYKVRKAEALQKLESSKSNLQRLQDIITEVKRQINSIDRYAKKAERYKKLFEEIKNIDVKIAKRDINVFNDEITKLTSSESTLKMKEAEISSKLRSSEALIEEKKRECIDREKALEKLKTRLHSSEKVLTENEGKIALLERDCENLRDRIDSLYIRDGELTGEKEAAATQLKTIEDKASELKTKLVNLESTLDDKNRSVSELEKYIIELEDNLETERKQLFNKAEEISILRNEIKYLASTTENITRKTEKSSDDINAVKDNLSNLETVIAEINSEHLKSESVLNTKMKIKEEIVSELDKMKQMLTESEESLYKEREELAACSSKLDSLKELDASQKNTVDERIKTLCQIADIFETRPEYETAIEAILGDKLNAAVVEDQHEITRALQLIKEQNTKRSGFIPVNPAKNINYAGRVLKGENYSLPSKNGQITNGVIGKAIDFVTVRDGFDKVAEALLRDVLVVDNLHNAFSLWEKSIANTNSRPSYFVTIDGEVLEPSGMVFGGVEKSVLKIRRQLKELEKDIASKREQILEKENIVAALKDKIKAAEDKITAIDDDISSKEKYRHELTVKITSMKEENERLLKRLEYLTIEKDEAEKEIKNLKGQMNEKNIRCQNLDTEKHQTESKIKSLQDSISEKKEFLERARTELTEAKLAITAIKEKMTSLAREKERLSSAMSDIEKKKAEMMNERLEMEEEVASKKDEIEKKKEELKSNVILISDLQKEVSKINEILEIMTSELASIEDQQKTFSSELETIRKEVGQVEMKKMESSMKLNYIKEDIRKTYSIEIETADIPDEVTPEEEGNLPQLKEKLKEMGPVSLGTLEEYEELKTRYDFLTKQQNDLFSSIATLEETIQKINRSTKKRLTEAFVALNEKFKEVFTTLFGEGRAELILTDGDILESGIDIVAQPPGKRLKNLLSLSGGEQALTALSLLFAGFMVKPTPMCIMDEVDAPLDESNTERFIKMLSELSKNIQFITITHNRITMESADYIYGVTMEEPGVSKVVSMHLAEA